MNIKNSIFFVFLSISIISCGEGKMNEQSVSYDSIKEVPSEKWKELSKKKIYFGHQSVGFNILDGIDLLKKEYPEINLNILETKAEIDYSNGVFGHSRIGKNYDPKSKSDDFAEILNGGLGKILDTAFLKYCYVDINQNSNIEEIYNYYANNLSTLKMKYPGTTFIHVTVPLKSTEISFKRRIKNLLKFKKDTTKQDNAKRNLYNEKLRNGLNQGDILFDLADVQSTLTNGQKSEYSFNGRKYFSMAKEYTYDGGHLNDLGKKKLAESLILLLISLK